MANRINSRPAPTPLQRADREVEQSARALIDSVPFVNQDDEGFLNLQRLAARQPAGLDYPIDQDGHSFRVVQAHAPLCATNRGGTCDCTPSAAVARVDPIELPHLNQRTGLTPPTKMPNLKKD